MEKLRDNIAQFNSSASTYDDEFTHSNIGSYQRQRVYHWLNHISFFAAPKKVLEINCGTGYDADKFHQSGHQVTATDISESMITYAKKHRSSSVEFITKSFDEVAEGDEVVNTDALFSNFGGLNCINNQQLSDFFAQIAEKQEKGKQIILVLMSKKCLIESIYFLLKGRLSQMNRRNTSIGIEVDVKGEKVVTHYYLPKEVKAILTPSYNVQLIKPIACFLPPSYMEPFFKKHKILLHFLNKLEQIFGRFTSMAKWADHYIIVAEKQ